MNCVHRQSFLDVFVSLSNTDFQPCPLHTEICLDYIHLLVIFGDNYSVLDDVVFKVLH